jgi:hypothetical protein
VPRLIQRYLWKGAPSDAYDEDDPRLALDALGAAFEAPIDFAPDSS